MADLQFKIANPLIVVMAGFVIYSVVEQLKLQRKIEKRMGLSDE